MRSSTAQPRLTGQKKCRDHLQAGHGPATIRANTADFRQRGSRRQDSGNEANHGDQRNIQRYTSHVHGLRGVRNKNHGSDRRDHGDR